MFEIKSEEQFQALRVCEDEANIIDFYAPWCEPCKNLAREITKVEAEMNYNFYKVDIDLIPHLCTELGVRTIPTLIAFKDGKILGRKTGQGTSEEIKQWVESLNDNKN